MWYVVTLKTLRVTVILTNGIGGKMIPGQPLSHTSDELAPRIRRCPSESQILIQVKKNNLNHNKQKSFFAIYLRS